MHAAHEHSGDRQVIQGRVAVCRWCSTPIILDPGGTWIHTSLSYACREVWGAGWASTNAEPRPTYSGRHSATD
jgi:hypothetical protein